MAISSGAIVHANQDNGLVQSYAKGYAITADIQGPESVLKNPAGLTHHTERTFVMNINNRNILPIYLQSFFHCR